jgi:hypothetical protein
MSAITTANSTYTKYSGPNAFPAPLQDNGDGSFSEVGAANQDLTAKVFTATGASTVTADLVNLAGRGIKVVIDITAVGGSPSAVVTVQGKDPTSGKFYTLLASAAITGTGTTILNVYPGMTAAANLVASDIVPRNFRISTVIGGTATPTITGTIGVCVIR